MLLNPKEPSRLEIEGHAYLLRVPTVVDRAHFRREVRVVGGRNWGMLELLDEMKRGIDAILGDEGEKQKEVIDLYREALQEFYQEIRTKTLDADDLRAKARDVFTPPVELAEIETVLSEHYIPYARKVADREVYPELAGLTAARMFLVGWEGFDEDFRRDAAGVTDDLLHLIPSPDLIRIGAEIDRMLEVPADRAKNSQSLSGGPGGQTVSNGTETLPKKARSKRTTGAAQNSTLTNSASTH